MDKFDDADEDADRGRYLSRRGFMCAAVSAGDLLRKEHASISARTRYKLVNEYKVQPW
jgi:hypothetical protein